MANYKANTTNVEWKKVLVPSNKLVFIYNGKEGKCAFTFAVATDDSISFMISSKLVRVNKDRTGFEISLPQGEVPLTKSVKDGDNWKREQLVANCVEDLGYPVVE